MARYYDVKTHTETDIESETTIIETDDRVKNFFKALEIGEYVIYENDLPVIKKVENMEQEK